MKILVSMLMAIILLLTFALPAFAADSPESITISNVQAFRNLAESGDTLIMFHYAMPYASDNYTTTVASRGIIFRLNNASGNVTQTGAPYVYPYFDTNGYGDGVGSFYMSATDNWTWGSAGVINILTTTLLTPYTIASYTLTAADYVTESTQEANRSLLADYVLLECDDLESTYEDTGVILKATSDAGIILSPYGEAYFQGVVTGLSTLCPELFFIQTSIPEVMDTTDYDLSAGEAIAARTLADDMGEGFVNLPTLFNMNMYAFWGIICVVATIVACVLTARKDWGIEPGLLIGAGVTTGMAFVLGGLIFGLIMLAAFSAIIALVWLLILRRA